jgi:hypothetical protein
VSRASSQFFLLSLFGVDRLRFVVAAACGLAVGWSIPAILYWAGAPAAPTPPVVVLAASLADLALLMAGLRVAAAVPADLPAGWIVHSAHPAPAAARSGLWRALYVLGVTPVLLAFGPPIWWSWGAVAALRHAAVVAAAGALLVEGLLWNHRGMPCVAPWRPENAKPGKRWPLYLAAFVAFSAGLARIETLVAGRPELLGLLILTLGAAAGIIRILHRRTTPWPDAEPDDSTAPAVLRLG